MTLQQRFYLSLGLIAGVVLVASVGGFGLVALNNHQNTTLAENLAISQGIEQVYTNILQSSRIIDRIFSMRSSSADLSGESNHLAETRIMVNQQLAYLQLQARTGVSTLAGSTTGLDRLLSSIFNPASPLSEDSLVQLQHLQSLSEEFFTQMVLIVSSAQQGDWDTASDLRLDNLAPVEDDFTGTIVQLRQSLQVTRGEFIEQITTLQQVLLFTGIGGILLFLGSAFILGINFQQKLIQPVRHLNQEIGSLVAGKTGGAQAPRLPVRSHGDELDQLFNGFKRLAEHLQTIESAQRIQAASYQLYQEKRNIQLRVAAQIGHEVVSHHQIQELLDHAVMLIRERFGFHHASIYLIDENREFATLRAAAGQAGQTMLERGYSLNLEPEKGAIASLIGQVIHTGEPRFTRDSAAEAAIFRNPLLTDTRSELALPLKIGGQIIGALDIHSREAQAFSDEEISILEIVANQLAAGIQNAHLVQEIRSQQNELQGFSIQDTIQQWQKASQISPIVGYIYQPHTGPRPITGQDLSTPAQDDNQPPDAYNIPLIVRGVPIGSLEVLPGENPLTPTDLRLLEQITERLSQALDSARLYETTRSRALREQALNQLTTNIARSMDMDSLLRNTVLELGRLPDVREASVVLSLGEPSTNESDAVLSAAPVRSNQDPAQGLGTTVQDLPGSPR